MDRFEGLKFSNCVSLLEALGGHGSSIEHLTRKYSEYSTRFDETLNFLLATGLVNKRGNRILLGRLNTTSETKDQDKASIYNSISRTLMARLISSSNSFATEVRAFLGNFKMQDGKLRFRPSFNANMQSANLRNFLMELDILEGNADSGYVIKDDNVVLRMITMPSRSIGRHEYLEILKKREDLGRRAEIEIIELERKRLANYPSLVRSIQHIADDDIGVGYDIGSFEGPDSRSESAERLIEVKAVSILSFEFHWTLNELKKARTARRSYYLYLLPVGSGGKFATADLLVIRDPFIRVFKNTKVWSRQCDSIIFNRSARDEHD